MDFNDENVKNETETSADELAKKAAEAIDSVTGETAEKVSDVLEATAEKATEIKEEATETVENKVEEVTEAAENKVEEVKAQADTVVDHISNEKEKAVETVTAAASEQIETVQDYTNVISEDRHSRLYEYKVKDEEKEIKTSLRPEKEQEYYQKVFRQPELTSTKEKKKSFGFVKALIWLLVTALLCGGSAYYAVQKTLEKVEMNNKEPQVIDNPGTTTVTNVTVTTSDLTNVVEKTADSVVEVYTEVAQYNTFYGEYITSGAGSGVIYSSDGYIITNHHVIDSATSIRVTLPDGTDYAATLVASDEKDDLAVLKIEATGLKAATLGTSSTLKRGEQVLIIGNPLGTLGGSVTTGILSALSREITIDKQKMTLLQTNAPINPGNSGGGMFNMAGELIGIVNAKSSGDNIEGIGFAIPVDVVRSDVEDMIKKGYVERPAIGISCTSIETRRAAQFYGLSRTGVYVNEVTGENARNAGLMDKDLIIGLDDKEINSYEDLQDALYTKKIGDEITLKVLRGSEEVSIRMVLGSNAR